MDLRVFFYRKFVAGQGRERSIARDFLQKKEKIRKNLRLATAFYICYNSGKNRGGLHMEPEKLLEALHTAEKLKDTTRHCYTSRGRHESVAEHSWRIALMAFWLRDEFPQADMDKVIRMCLIHDLGECFTGDIPAFDKTAADEAAEEALLSRWVDSLPEPVCTEMRTLYAEMAALQTTEAKIYKALDKMEAVVQHNESAIATWEPQEYALNLTYGVEQSLFSPYMQALREALRQETLRKMEQEGATPQP